jgi:hypothetical protein
MTRQVSVPPIATLANEDDDDDEDSEESEWEFEEVDQLEDDRS